MQRGQLGSRVVVLASGARLVPFSGEKRLRMVYGASCLDVYHESC